MSCKSCKYGWSCIHYVLTGQVPELDSLMVANLLMQIETEFQIRIEDDEIDGTLFATVGSLLKFIEQKKGS